MKYFISLRLKWHVIIISEFKMAQDALRTMLLPCHGSRKTKVWTPWLEYSLRVQRIRPPYQHAPNAHVSQRIWRATAGSLDVPHRWMQLRWSRYWWPWSTSAGVTPVDRLHSGNRHKWRLQVRTILVVKRIMIESKGLMIASIDWFFPYDGFNKKIFYELYLYRSRAHCTFFVLCSTLFHYLICIMHYTL